MPTTAASDDDALARRMADQLERHALLQGLGARIDAAEPGYVEISAPAEGAADGPRLAAGAVAALAEAAGRMAIGREGESAELSLHLHGCGALEGAERLIARGETLRDARAERPLATAQADVFRLDREGGEALLATALITAIVD